MPWRSCLLLTCNLQGELAKELFLPKCWREVQGWQRARCLTVHPVGTCQQQSRDVSVVHSPVYRGRSSAGSFPEFTTLLPKRILPICSPPSDVTAHLRGWIPTARPKAPVLPSRRSSGSSVVWLFCKRRCQVTIWTPCQNGLWRWEMCSTQASAVTSSCRSWDSVPLQNLQSALLWAHVFMLLSAEQLQENTMTGVSHYFFPFSPGTQADCLPLVLLLWLASGYTGICRVPTCNITKKNQHPQNTWQVMGKVLIM